MILHELKALALREGLVDDPAFESKPVPWIIVLNEDGSYSGLRDTYQEVSLPEGKKGKPKRQASMFSIPRRPVGKTSQNLASHLVDTLEYVVCVPAEPTAKQTVEQMTKRAQKRHDLYINDLKQAIPNQTAKEVDAILRFLSKTSDLSQCRMDLNEVEAASGDLVTFRVGSEFLHDSPMLLQAWREKNLPKAMDDPEAIRAQCLVCGELDSEIARLHESIKIPGGFGGGIPIVSAKEEAFKKYNLLHTAPVCKTCMTAYVEGFRRLQHERYINAHTSQTVVPQSTPLSSNTTAVYWANVETELTNVLTDLIYSPQKVKDLLRSPHRGIRSSSTQGRFFCLIFGGVEGRAMMRSVHNGTLDDLEENLERYFNAIQVRSDESEPLPLIRLLLSTIAPDPQRRGDRPTKKEWEKRLLPGVIGKIWLGVLFGDPLPLPVLSAAVTRNKVEGNVTDERAALLQLYFVSHEKKDKKEKAKMSVDTETTDTPYRLGRLLAAYEDLQYAAHQARSANSKLNRTLVDRYYGAASTRPNVVFPQIAKLSQSHSRILGRYRKRPEKLIMEIVFPLEGIEFPAMLTIEEQGKFALGFYKQRQDIKIKRDERRAAAIKRKLEGKNDPITEETVPTAEGETYA
jgi:CRISPR-associated protein Csd1